MSIVSRQALYWTLSILVAAAIMTAAVQAALTSRAVGPIIAAVLGTALLPALARGASSGRMRTSTAWIIAAIGCVICVTATIGLEPSGFDSITLAWYTCGILAGAVMVWMAGHRLPPVVAITCLVVHVSLWAGPIGVIRLGLAGEIVIVVAGLVLHRAVDRVTEAMRVAADRQRETVLWQAELDAFQLERQERVRLAGLQASPMLRRIIADRGELDPLSRAECRVLEQTLRDEIRGRRLLNDAVRSVVVAHRRRGALVQVLDDGGLDAVPPPVLNAILDDVAQRLEPLRSSRIVIRTGRPQSVTAVTIVASSPDPTDVALGLDGDDEVDYWATIARPSDVGVPALNPSSA